MEHLPLAADTKGLVGARCCCYSQKSGQSAQRNQHERGFGTAAGRKCSYCVASKIPAGGVSTDYVSCLHRHAMYAAMIALLLARQPIWSAHHALCPACTALLCMKHDNPSDSRHINPCHCWYLYCQSSILDN